jgi:hypothetical protein
MNESKDKKVDEAWKQAVEKEKQRAATEAKQEHQIPEVNFANFITSLSLQALISLGEIENPLTSKKEENLKQAMFLIDTLDMIREKTEGNLTKEEKDILETIIYDLKMKFVEKDEGGL